MIPAGGTIQRRILNVLRERCAEEMVVALHGPRSVGKSTVLAAYAHSCGVPVIDFDNLEVRESAILNPQLAVGGATPVCVDEYQKAPEVLDAIKARLNADGGQPGTAVLTGSTRHDALPRTAQALTGRLHVLNVLPFSQGELEGTLENFIESLFADPDATIAAHPVSSTTRSDYIERTLAGGLPLAVGRLAGSRSRWFDDYVAQSVERDVLELSNIRDRQLLRAVLERVAGQTGHMLNVTKLGGDSGAKHATIENYLRLLEDLYLVQRLPAWGTTLRSKVKKHPKIHVVDSGVAARLLRLTANKLGTFDPSAMSEFGSLLETFVAGEVRKQVSWMEEAVTLGHWRTNDDDEVDIVIEGDDGRIVAIEVKANERVQGSDLKGLRGLRDVLGERFIAGVALSTGSRSYTYEDRIHVCPTDRLWRAV